MKHIGVPLPTQEDLDSKDIVYEAFPNANRIYFIFLFNKKKTWYLLFLSNKFSHSLIKFDLFLMKGSGYLKANFFLLQKKIMICFQKLQIYFRVNILKNLRKLLKKLVKL